MFFIMFFSSRFPVARSVPTAVYDLDKYTAEVQRGLKCVQNFFKNKNSSRICCSKVSCAELKDVNKKQFKDNDNQL